MILTVAAAILTVAAAILTVAAAILTMVEETIKRSCTLKLLKKGMAASYKAPKGQILSTPPTIQIARLGNFRVMMLDHQPII